MNDRAIFVPAWEIAMRVRNRECSVRETVEAHLRLIRLLNPRLRAFVSVDEEGAQREAIAADEAIAAGKPLGSLHGVPVTIKSSIDVKGLRCEAGTRLRKGHIANSDAP